MKVWVVDASVAAKWLLPAAGEDLVPAANHLLRLHVQREVQLLAPAFIWAEIGNVLWKAVRANRLTQSHAEDSLAQFRDLDLSTVPSEDLMGRALQIATTCNRTFYDSLYVALALHAKADLITADERLANALASRFPVRWLGAFHE